jgi:hypothetical protein
LFGKFGTHTVEELDLTTRLRACAELGDDAVVVRAEGKR